MARRGIVRFDGVASIRRLDGHCIEDIEIGRDASARVQAFERSLPAGSKQTDDGPVETYVITLGYTKCGRATFAAAASQTAARPGPDHTWPAGHDPEADGDADVVGVMFEGDPPPFGPLPPATIE